MFSDKHYRHKIKTIINCNEITYEDFCQNKENMESIYYNTMLCTNLFMECDVKFISGDMEYHLHDNVLVIKDVYNFSKMSTEKPFKKWYLLAVFCEIVSRTDCEYSELIQKLLKLQQEKTAVKISKETAEKLQVLWNDLYHLPVNESELRDKMSRTLFLNIIEAMTNGEEIKGIPVDLGAAKVRKVVDYIRANLSADLSVNKISEDFFYSKHSLCRIFKKHTGYTINQFVVICRVAESVKYLYDGYSVDAAGLACGFGSTKTYIEAFKAIYNITPKQFILNEKAKN